MRNSRSLQSRKADFKHHSSRQRRGATLVLAVVMMFVLFGFVAFSIDTGYLAQARSEMRRSADAAAMAGCWEVYSKLDSGGEVDLSDQAVRDAAAEIAALNPICRQSPALDTSEQSQEVKIGYLANVRESALSDDSTLPYVAVKVTLNRTESRNGEVPFFFGKMFGDGGRPMTSEATAVMAQQISGFLTPGEDNAITLEILPFALDVDTWDAMMLGNCSIDDYGYDTTNDSVDNSGDGIFEVNLYPQGTGSPGNRGTVDIGGSNNSTNDIARQITDGISREDILELGKPLALSGGEMTLEGDTGISAGVKDELASIIGTKRIIPLFSSVSGNGNNAEYTIVRWVGVRVLHVKLTGKMSGKKVIVQPAPILTSNGITNADGGLTSDFVLTPVVLAN